MTTPPELDRITDKVLAYRPTLKAIAGAEDKPLVINGIEIPAYVLEDETRVLSERGFLSAIGRSERRPGRLSTGADKLPGFLSAENLRPFIDKALTVPTNPIKFQPPQGGPPAYGYPAELLPQVCDVYLRARAASALRANQLHIAERAEIVVRGLATVGIIGLVDEATGYQRVRGERALAKILEDYIARELQPWTKTFPYSFYEEIYRLRGWAGPHGAKRPSVIGKYTNDVVYERIAPGVLSELRSNNPTLPSGGRKDKHHQWFTPDLGHPKLKEHLAAVTALMRAAPDWPSFMRILNRAFPRLNTQMLMHMEEEDQQQSTP